MAIVIASRIERQASSRVIGSLPATVFVTVSRVRMDSPRSPRSARPTQRRYWTGTGSLRPYFSRTSARPASSASVPAMTRAGSPGIMRTPVKTIMLITARVTAEIARRWIRYSSTTVRLLPGHALDADETVRHGLVAFEVLRKRDDIVSVVDVDDVAPDEGELVHGLSVERGPLSQIGDLARPVQDDVHALVARLRGVQRGAAGLELEDVGVRIDTAAPADQEGLVLARVIVVERRGKLGRLEADVEASLLCHALDDLAGSPVLGIVDDDHLEAVAARLAGVGEELLRLGDVAHGALAALVGEGAHGRDGCASDRVLAIPHDLVQRLAVDAEFERLPDPRVIGQRRAQVSGRLGRLAVLVVEIDRDAEVPDAGDARDLDLALLAEVGGIRRSDLVHHVDVARTQVRQPHVVVGDDP